MTQEWVFDTFGGYGNSYAKISAGNITSICLNMVIQINDLTQELVLDTFEGNHVRMPKMMLPATQTSCLKDSHTNFQVYVGIVI